MIDAVALLENLTRRGVRLTLNPPKLVAEPSRLLTDEDRAAIRAHKPELLDLLAARAPANTMLAPTPASSDPASEALAIVARLKGYTLPSGRMPAARAIAERLRPLLAASDLDPAAALTTLQSIETELNALGAAPNRELAEAVGLVTPAFAGARLIEVKKLQ